MKKSIKTTHTIQASLDPVWNLIKTGKQWERWLPILTGSRVEGHQRYCDMENGDVLEERFLASDAEKTFIYAIDKQASFPATNIVGIMRLEAAGSNQTTLHWSVDMDVADEATFQGLRQNIEGVYEASASQLQSLAA